MNMSRLKERLYAIRYDALKHISFRWRPRLWKDIQLSKDEIADLNWRRRQNIIKFAYDSIPFYREKYMSANFSPNDLHSPDDWKHIPILTKEEVRNEASRMLSTHDSLSILNSCATGGSTGEPVQFYSDPHIPNTLLGWPFLEKLGISTSDSMAVVGRNVPTTIRRRLFHIALFPQKRVYLNAGKIIDNNAMQKFAKEIIQFKISYIYGYVGAILQFAEFCHNKSISFQNLKLVWTTSAPLADFQRKIIEKAFSCKTYNQYGCCEMPWLAVECEKQNGMHIFSNIRHIEITDEFGEILPYKTYGKIIITNLLDFRFPLIRYSPNDRGRLFEHCCPCGCSLPMMDYVRGRDTDSLILPNGSKISGDFLTTVFDDYPNAVKMFQFLQKRNGDIILSVIKNSNYENSNLEIALVEKKLLSVFNYQTNLILQEVSEIQHNKGKTCFVVREK